MCKKWYNVWLNNDSMGLFETLEDSVKCAEWYRDEYPRAKVRILILEQVGELELLIDEESE